jgi:hypothetical protein
MRNGVWVGIAVVALMAFLLFLSLVTVNSFVEVKKQLPYTVQETRYYNDIVNETKPYGARECEKTTYKYEPRFTQTYEPINGTLYNVCRLYAKNIESKPGNFTFFVTVTAEDRTYDYGDIKKEIQPGAEELFMWTQIVDMNHPISCAYGVGEIQEFNRCEYPYPNFYVKTQRLVKKNYTVNVTQYREGYANETKKISLLKWIFT